MTVNNKINKSRGLKRQIQGLVKGLDTYTFECGMIYINSMLRGTESEKPRKHPSGVCGKVFVVGKVFASVRKNLIAKLSSGKSVCGKFFASSALFCRSDVRHKRRRIHTFLKEGKKKI